VDLDFEKFYKKYMNDFDIRIISRENPLTIPSTLFFLSKVRSRYMNYHFFENNEDIWSKMDCIITTDPELIKAKPQEKKLIVFKRLWNTELSGDLDVLSIVEMLEGNKFESLFNSGEQKLLDK
jgi:hypothetical protein